MPELDKWQKREAEQYAADNGVGYDAAVKVLFPDEPAEAPADEPAAEAEKEPAAAKTKTTK